ncbi:MAG: hypothetical protein ACFCD0_16870 [Gemmataceae bacterium]
MGHQSPSFTTTYPDHLAICDVVGIVEQDNMEPDKLPQASLEMKRKVRVLEWRGLSQEQ